MQQTKPSENEPKETELQPDRPPSSPSPTPGRKPRGFAAMDPTLVAEIARKGGKAAHSAGTAHEFTSEEARAAGRKGGQASHARRRERQQQKP
jgi:general stress protein YciG